MKASDILQRARALADLGNTKFIDHDYELHSLNESWKDIYAALLANDDDYYLTETTLTLTSVHAVAGSDSEYLIDLPTDAVRVRYLDWNGTTGWLPMDRFNLGMKDHQPGDPYYRLKNGKLWVIGGTVPSTGLSIRVGYYPTPATITCPADPYEFTTSYARATLASVGIGGFTDYNNTGIYIYSSMSLRAESIDRNTTASPVSLFTDSAAVGSVLYHKGYLYWVRQANIYRKATDLTAAFTVPSAVTSSNDVVDFQIYGDTIYFITSTAVKSCALDGTGTATIQSGLTCTRGAAVLASVVYYVDGTTLKSVAPAATVLTSVTDVTSDGTYLYVHTSGTDHKVKRLTISAGAITATDTIHSDATGMAPYQGGRLPILQQAAQTFVAIDTAVDYDFSYPNNLVPEIMAYRAAVDYRIKQAQDATKLEERLASLWERFSSMIRRDDYKPERIRNAYTTGGWR